MIELALEDESNGWKESESSLTKEEVIKFYFETLNEKNRKILKFYFKIKIDENFNLFYLPLILDNYKPSFVKLPSFLFSLATLVNWESEKECFESISKQISKFYSLDWFNEEENIHQDVEQQEDQEDQEDQKKVKNIFSSQSSSSIPSKRAWIIEHIILSHCKSGVPFPKKFTTDRTVIQIASLDKLYKIFERC